MCVCMCVQNKGMPCKGKGGVQACKAWPALFTAHALFSHYQCPNYTHMFYSTAHHSSHHTAYTCTASTPYHKKKCHLHNALLTPNTKYKLDREKETFDEREGIGGGGGRRVVEGLGAGMVVGRGQVGDSGGGGGEGRREITELHPGSQLTIAPPTLFSPSAA